jgi:hypothetical protein
MTLERDDQAVLVAWLRDVAALRWANECIPGEGFPFVISHSAGKRKGKAITAAKKQGLRSGIPDIFIPISRGEFAGLWIELKRGTGRTTVSAAQKAWLAWLNLHGFCARICHGAEAAQQEVINYMGGWRRP